MKISKAEWKMYDEYRETMTSAGFVPMYTPEGWVANYRAVLKQQKERGDAPTDAQAE